MNDNENILIWEAYKPINSITIYPDTGEFEEVLDDLQIDYSDFYNEIDNIVANSGINILSDKSLYAVSFNKSDNDIIGVLYVSVINDEFSFDIVINPKYQGKGFGKKLIDNAISEYNSLKDAYPDLTIVVDVVNPNLVKHLQKIGFKTINQYSNRSIMKYE